MKKALVAGGGGFIGGFFAKNLLDKGYDVVVADIKPKDEWYQIHDKAKNYFDTSMANLDNVLKVMDGCEEVYNFSCNMGGIGFCEQNHLQTGLSVEINTNIIKGAMKIKPKKIFYSSSACVYNENLQKDANDCGLKEADAWPAQPDLLYGMEKLFSEEMYKYLYKEYQIPVYIARFHNVYGPLGTWDGGREKAPAAAIKKMVTVAKDGVKKADVGMWGDGLQTRSFMYIDDCIEGLNRIINEPNLIANSINLGSDEQITIKGLHDMAAKFADIEPNYIYDLDAPKGVRGRNSDNTKIKEILGWAPGIALIDGMKKTYDWIWEDFDNPDSPYRKYHEIRW